MTHEMLNPETPDIPCRPVLFTDAESMRQVPTFFRSTLVGLVGSAHRIALAAPAGSDLHTVPCPAVDILRYPLWIGRLLQRKSRERFVESLTQFKPTVLHGIWPQHARLLDSLSRQLHIPCVLSFFKPVRGIAHLLSPPALAQGCMAATELIRRTIEPHVPKEPGRLVTIPPGCYAESKCACFADRNRKASCIMIHSIHRLEDFEPLLQAVRHLLLDGFEFFLGILGSGRAESALRRRIRTLGLASSISIVPMMDSCRDMLCGADIYIRLRDPGRYDPMLTEAMSVGLAVASCADEVSDLLQDGQTAVLFEPEDELSIYTGLKKLLSRPESARQMAAAAQERIRISHQVSRMIDRLLETYLTVQKQYPAGSRHSS